MATRGEVGLRIFLDGYEVYSRQLTDVANKEKAAGDAAAAAGQKAAQGASGVNTFSSSLNRGASEAVKFASAVVGIQMGAELAVEAVRHFIGAVIENDRAMALLQARVGATSAQMEGLSAAVGELAVKNFGTAKTEIASTAAAVANFQGISASSSEEIQRLTQNALDLATVFGGDGVQKVKLLDDALDAWNQTANGSIELSDKLVVGQQKFGAEIDSTAATLQTLAPTFQALGLSLNDALGYMNLFASSGIKADATARAFQTAVALLSDSSQGASDKLAQMAKDMGLTATATAAFLKLSPAQIFQQFTQFLNSSATATQKLTTAIDLFGPSGVKIAQALDSKKVDDYTVATEAAAGATEKAGNVARATADSGYLRLQRQVEEAAIAIATNLEPAFGGLADAIDATTGFIGDNIDALLLLLNIGLLPVGLAILALKGSWDKAFQEMPGPVQSLAIAVAVAFDAITGSISTAINFAINRMNDLIGAYNSTIGKIAGGIDKIGNIDLGTGVADALRGARAGSGHSTANVMPPDEPIPFSNNFNAKEPTGSPNRPPPSAGPKEAAKAAAKTALDGFLAALDELHAQQVFEEKFGDLGGKAIMALAKAVKEGASEAEGAAIVSSVSGMIEAAKLAGVNMAEETGDEILKALQTALTTKTPEAFEAAANALGQFSIAVTEAKKATKDALDAIGAELDASVEATGSAGDAIAAALVNAITKGTPDAVRAFEAATRGFSKEAKDAGVTTGKDLTDALAAAIKDGTPAAVQAALDMIRAIDTAMQTETKAVEMVNTLGDALVEALRRAQAEEDQIAQEAEQARQEAARKQLADQQRALRDGSELAQRAADARHTAEKDAADAAEQALEDGLRAQIDAVRNAAGDETDAIRQRYDDEIQSIKDTNDVTDQAERDKTESVRRASRDRADTLRSETDTVLREIDRQTEGALAGIQAQMDALTNADNADKRDELQSRLAITYDNRARYELQRQIDAQTRTEQRQTLQGQADAVRKGADAAKQAAKDTLAAALDALDKETQATLDALDLQGRARKDTTEKQIRALQDQRDAEIKAAQATSAARIDALQAALDAAKKSYAAQSKALDEAYQHAKQASADALDQQLRALQAQEAAQKSTNARVTSDFALQAKARELIEGGHWDEIQKIIAAHYPEWATAGLTLGQQIVLGMRNSGVQQFIDDLLAKMNAARVGGGSTGGVGIANTSIREGWNLITTLPGGPFSINTLTAGLQAWTSAGGQRGTNITGTGQIVNQNTPLWIYRPPGIVMDTGGIAMGPTHALLAQNGVPEMVLPLPRMADMMRGGPTISADFRGAQFMGTPEENGQAVEDAMRAVIEAEFGRNAFLSGVN